MTGDFAGIESALSLPPILGHIGFSIETAKDGVYRCRVPLEPQNGNHIGTVHAAVQWALAEAVGGVVLFTSFDRAEQSKIFGAVKAASIEFIRPARTAIVAEAKVDASDIRRLRDAVAARENASFELDVIVRDDSGQTVATFRGEYVVRPRRTQA